MSKFFTARRIFENVTQIEGLGRELCYLVEGNDRALLIDGLTGVGSLKAFVRELTDLPVTLALTHGHVDHAGASFEYGACLMHPDDVALLYAHGVPERRFGFVQRETEPGAFKPVMEDVVPLCAVRTLPLYDGAKIDLGIVELEIIGVPGHSHGTLVFLDRAHRAVYSGDACNPNTLLALEGSATIETYRESLLHFASFADEFDCLYGGHGTSPVPKSILAEAVTLCDEIMAGTDDAFAKSYIGRDFLYARRFSDDFRREDGGLANIAYKKENIFNQNK